MFLVDEYIALPALAASLTRDWPIRFADPASAADAVRQAATELGLDLQVLGR